jgi:hypothetical protein
VKPSSGRTGRRHMGHSGHPRWSRTLSLLVLDTRSANACSPVIGAMCSRTSRLCDGLRAADRRFIAHAAVSGAGRPKGYFSR